MIRASPQYTCPRLALFFFRSSILIRSLLIILSKVLAARAELATLPSFSNIIES